MNVVTATKTYYVSESFLKLSFQNAGNEIQRLFLNICLTFVASLCKFCFNTNLADISNAVAIIGSPFHDQVPLLIFYSSLR